MTADTGAFLSLHHRWLGLSCLDEAKTSTAAFGIRVCETVQWRFHVKCLYFEKCLLVFVTDPFFIFSTRAQHRLLFKLSTHGDHLFVPSLLFSLHFIKNWKCWRVCVCVWQRMDVICWSVLETTAVSLLQPSSPRLEAMFSWSLSRKNSLSALY